MAKLSKMQAQAVISKLGREAKVIRERQIKEAESMYVHGEEAQELIRLFEKRDKAQKHLDELHCTLKEKIEGNKLGTYYNYKKKEDFLDELKKKVIYDKYPSINLDEALDDLIIASIDEDFDTDNFIKTYLKKLNG